MTDGAHALLCSIGARDASVRAEVRRRGQKLVVSYPVASPELADIPGAVWSKSVPGWVLPASPACARALERRVPLTSESIVELEPLLKVADRIRAAQRWKTEEPPALPFPTPRPAWRHQLQAYAFASRVPAALLYMGMATGKSRVVCDLVHGRNRGRVLILAPKSAVAVWRGQLEEHLGIPYRAVFLDKGSTVKKAKEAERLWCVTVDHPRGVPAVVVVNYEAAWREPLASYLLDTPPELVVCDEVHRIKSAGGKASRFVARLGARVPYRLGLSGTPTPHSPLDAFGVFRFLDPGIFGTSFVRFRSRYAVLGGYENREVVGFQNERDFSARFHSITFEARTADVLELPAEQDLRLEVELTPPARKLYRDVRDELVAELESGRVTVSNAAVKLLRLQQVTSGFLGDGETEHEIHTRKLEALGEWLEDLPPREPVVVFCRFTRDVRKVAERVRKSGRSAAVLDGSRNELAEWQAGDADVLVVQIQAGAEGIDLSRSCYAVYFSLGFSLGQYQQSRARINRPGQSRPVAYFHLIAPGTVDDYVYRALQKRQDVVEYVLGAFHA